MSQLPAASPGVIATARRARAAIKDVRRLREILGILIRNGFGYLLERWRLRDRSLFSGVADEEAPSPDLAPEESLPARVRRLLEELGPTFVKLGQILSSRPDLVPPEFAAEFTRLRDQVPPVPFERIREQIVAGLGAPLGELFASIQEAPLAAASIAQVHRAKLLDGAEVAVKVQRPGIEQVMLDDLSLLHTLARELESALPELQAVDLVGMVRELERAARRELDFTQEARNLARFARIFATRDDVRVPHAFPSHCCRQVVTMEFVQGVKVAEAVQQGHDPERLTRTLLQSILYQIFAAGTFHGDLHPGNVLVTPDGRVCYLDLGLVGHLNAQARDRVADLLIALARGEEEAITSALLAIAIKEAPVEREAVAEEVTELLDLHLRDRPLAEVYFSELLWDLLQRGARHGLRVPPAYTMMLRALITSEALARELQPQVDLVSELKPYVADILRQRHDPQRLTRELAATALEASRVLQSLPASMQRLVWQAEHGSLRVNLELGQSAEARRVLRDLADRWALAMLASGLAVAASLALGAPVGRLAGISVVSFVAYLLSGLLTVWLLVKLVRGRK